MRNNLVYLNQVSGIAFGGASGNHGTAQGCRIENNTLFFNDTTESGTGEFLIHRANGCTLRNNLVYVGRQNKLFSSELKDSETFGNTWDFNLW